MPTSKELTIDFSDPKLFNPTYLPLLDDDSEFLDLWGSAGSGKSRFVAQKEIIKSFEPERARRATIVSRKVYATLKDSCYAELMAVIYEWGLEDLFHTTTSPLFIQNKITKVKFLFRGFDNVEKIKSIVGADRAWYEETTEADNKKEILQLRNRLRGFNKVQVTCSYNPIDEHNWINTEIHEAEGHAGHTLHHSTYKDNIRMLEKDPHYETFIESTKDTDPNYYRVYGQGLWGTVVEGLIYRNITITKEFPQLWGEDDIHFYGLDFGFSDPTALIAMHVQDALPKKRLINKEVIYKTGLDGPALVREFHKAGVRKDRVIIADAAQPGLIKTLRDAGYNIKPCLKFQGSVLVGINDIRKFEFCAVAGSKELIKEARNYQKDEKQGKRLETPAPYQVDHALDAVRYGVQKAVAPVRTTKKQTSTSQSMFG